MATRAEVILRAREYADAEDSVRWGEQEVLTAVDVTFRREWNTILASAPYARTNIVTTETDANGLLPFTSLSTGTGDDARRFRNLIQLSDGLNVFAETRVDLVAPNAEAQQFLFYDTGVAFQLLPMTQQVVRAVVNWMPVAPANLAGDTSVVDFPEDGLPILAMGAAALMLAKGGTETTEAASLLNLASQLREDMLSSIRRRTNMPKFMRYSDRASSWAGR